MGKTFSFFIKPYLTIDPGINVNSSSFYSHNQIAYLPTQKINFSGIGMLGGIAFHFGKGKV